MKLLESFSKIANGSTYIVYSTHSHYMINPFWLDKAYIILNSAIDYDSEDKVDSFSVHKTDITAKKYRSFVASNPARTTYFQPVLDALDVEYSPLERSARALIIEGKFDYHPFVYLRKRGRADKTPEVFPANGAGDIGLLVNLFRGWGVDFRVLVDDDKAGREAKKRCTEDYLVSEKKVATLGEIVPELSGKPFEGIYQEDVQSAVRTFFGVDQIKKRQYSLFFQELLAKDAEQDFPATEEIFSRISAWIDREFENVK